MPAVPGQNFTGGGGGGGGTGLPGSDGWTPVIGIVADGERRVLQISNWTGGGGAVPATGFLAAGGILVATAAGGLDLRGAPGIDSSGGGGSDDGVISGITYNPTTQTLTITRSVGNNLSVSLSTLISATALTTALVPYAQLANPIFTGNPQYSTIITGTDNSSRLANTRFVQSVAQTLQTAINARAPNTAFTGFTQAGNTITFTRASGANPLSFTISAGSGGGGTADGVITGLTLDTATQIVSVARSVGAPLTLDLSYFASRIAVDRENRYHLSSNNLRLPTGNASLQGENFDTTGRAIDGDDSTSFGLTSANSALYELRRLLISPRIVAETNDNRLLIMTAFDTDGNQIGAELNASRREGDDGIEFNVNSQTPVRYVRFSHIEQGTIELAEVEAYLETDLELSRAVADSSNAFSLITQGTDANGNTTITLSNGDNSNSETITITGGGGEGGTGGGVLLSPIFTPATPPLDLTTDAVGNHGVWHTITLSRAMNPRRKLVFNFNHPNTPITTKAPSAAISIEGLMRLAPVAPPAAGTLSTDLDESVYAIGHARSEAGGARNVRLRLVPDRLDQIQISSAAYNLLSIDEEIYGGGAASGETSQAQLPDDLIEGFLPVVNLDTHIIPALPIAISQSTGTQTFEVEIPVGVNNFELAIDIDFEIDKMSGTHSGEFEFRRSDGGSHPFPIRSTFSVQTITPLTTNIAFSHEFRGITQSETYIKANGRRAFRLNVRRTSSDAYSFTAISASVRLYEVDSSTFTPNRGRVINSVKPIPFTNETLGTPTPFFQPLQISRTTNLILRTQTGLGDNESSLPIILPVIDLMDRIRPLSDAQNGVFTAAQDHSQAFRYTLYYKQGNDGHTYWAWEGANVQGTRLFGLQFWQDAPGFINGIAFVYTTFLSAYSRRLLGIYKE